MGKKKSKPPEQAPASPRENFRREIEHLLSEIPSKIWDDPEIRGVAYDFIPWHSYSSISLQSRDDDPKDIASWEHFELAESGKFVRREVETYKNSGENGRLVYHQLLIEAAEALLSIDFTRFINPKLPQPILNLRDWSVTDDEGFCLNKTFLLQVYDSDGTFRFNYCEYVIARRLEQTGG